MVELNKKQNTQSKNKEKKKRNKDHKKNGTN